MTCIFVRTAYDQLMPSLERYRGAPIAGERPSRPNCAHDSKNARQRAENVCFDAVGSTEKLFVTGGNKSLPSAVSPRHECKLASGPGGSLLCWLQVLRRPQDGTARRTESI
jgi:hypothetical protein